MAARMLIRRTAAALACALLLGAPATAIAQSAGDNQYFDPVGPDDGGNGSNSNGGDSSGSGTAPTPAPAPTTPSGTNSAGTAPATTAPATAQEGTAAAPGELPRTGGDPLPFAVAGFWLLLGGVALRARVRPR